MKQVFVSPGFIVLLIIASAIIIKEFINPIGMYGASNWSLTYYMVELIQGAFSLSIIIVITFYTAEVEWRARNTGIVDIVDSMPVHNFIFWLSKLLAVSLIVVVLLGFGMLFTLANQLRDPNKIDPVCYVSANEVAQQWFGHQLLPANVQGSAVLSETLSQYAALQLMVNKYGETKLRQFLSSELDDYLRGRSTEYLQEMPLMRAENQAYIYYNKGSIVMMAIADRIGFDKLNKAIKGLLEKFENSNSRKATTLDLLSAIKEVADPKAHAFINQQFSDINLYNIKLLAAKWEKETSQVNLKIDAARVIADGLGNETPAVFDDVVDIVVFANDPSDFSSETVVLYRQKHRLVNGENELVIRLDGSLNDGSQPAYVGVDPFVRFIGTDVKDNVLRIKTKAEE
jgi:hypothetical protein